ncbi:TraG family conjugative transposon ATPase [Hymenobacter latericus]|uniref:TraG family conjugative transposon ATPase n=1 Tax=Hymenobacter sp. YIM 151858-1 TaxID=2987688 RepID=UPI00222611EB|nr:TraG family conjugative transposon ATPase [Hymenobacter sp. YIM 151858-1]UYZ61150.1 TraG family conjugative transposon ATPase [Hymenobacter sp. YIM 151858-1]
MSPPLVLPSASLEQLQPIYRVERGCLISKNADLTIAFRLELPELFTLAPAEYQALHAAVVKALRVLPTPAVVHKQDWFTSEAYRPDFTAARLENSLLGRAYERHFFERPFLRHECFLFVTRTASERAHYRSPASLLTRRHLVPRTQLDAQQQSAFFDAVGQFKRLLEDAGPLRLHPLTEDELVGTDTQTGLLEQYLALELSAAAPLVDLDFSRGLQVGGKHCQLFSLARLDDLPAEVDPAVRYEPLSTDRSPLAVGLASPLGLLLGCNHLYNQYIFLDDAAQTLRRYEKRKDNLNALSLYSRQNAINRQWYEQYLNEALAEQKQPVRAHCNVLAWSERESELPELRNLVSAAIARLGCRPRESTVDAPAIFWAGIPGNAGDFPAEETFPTFAAQAACFWNVETNYRDAGSPFGLKLSDRLTGRPVLVDLSDEPMRRGVITNRNKFILGPSGSGKSFFTNAMVRQYYEQGTHVLLVDTGNSYQGLCALLGGVYLTYEEQDPIAFNPFLVSGGGAPDAEKKESLKVLLQTLWKKDDEPATRAEYVSLTNAVELYYEQLSREPELRPCFNTFYEFVRGPYAAVLREQQVREKDFDLHNFLYVLKPYYRGGAYDYLLNAERELDLVTEPFIVFELDNIKDNPILFPVVTLIIMETFIAKMRRLKGTRKMILIEEAWKAIATAGMAEYIRYLFKTVRKFFGEAVIVTQEVDDIVGNAIVKNTIINNSDCKILLDQRKYAHRFEEIQQLLSLSNKEKAQVLSINLDLRPGRHYKEVFISLGGTVSKVYATEVSPEEYVTYTTEEKEKLRLQALTAERAGDLPGAIRAYAQELREQRA